MEYRANADRFAGEQNVDLMRVILQQSALPKYRVPVFRKLACRPGIDLKLLYGSTPGLTNVEPDGFEAEYVPLHRREVFGQPAYWHAPQWSHAQPDKADVLIVSWDLHYASLAPGLLRAKANGVPTIAWGHGASKREGVWRKTLRQKVGQLATTTLFYNQTIAQRFVDSGADPNRVFVALNSLDQQPIQQARRHWLERPADLEAFRRANRLGEGPVILFVSRLDPANRLELLIQAAARMASRSQQLRVVIIGKGEDESHLRKLVVARGLEKTVIFPGALYDELQLAPWFLTADVFCYPANVGLSMLHAFGYGVPAVTSDNAAAQNPEIEALCAGENGLLYRGGDAEALEAALERIMMDSNLRRRMSDAALRTVSEQFTLDRMVDGFEAAIRYCAQSRPA